jgi:hypothetical protein
MLKYNLEEALGILEKNNIDFEDKKDINGEKLIKEHL